MSDTDEQFDDPALKLALRRAIPAATCPEALRARIQQAADELAAPEPLRLPQTPATPRSPLRFLHAHRMAIAASILGLAGGMALFNFAGNSSEELAAIDTDASVLQPVAYSLAQQHSGMSDDPMLIQNHAQATAERNLAAASEIVQKQLGRPLPFDTFTAAGWQFHGADACRLDNSSGTHLIFGRPGQSVSMFILPAQAAGHFADGHLYTMTTGQKPVAAAIRGRWLICLVGASTDGSLKADHLANLLKQLLPTQ